MKLIINSQTSAVVPLTFWEWISNFIPNFSGYVITYPCSDKIIERNGTYNWLLQVVQRNTKWENDFSLFCYGTWVARSTCVKSSGNMSCWDCMWNIVSWARHLLLEDWLFPGTQGNWASKSSTCMQSHWWGIIYIYIYYWSYDWICPWS